MKKANQVLRRWPEMNDRRFLRFIEYLLNIQAASEVAARLQREGVDLYRVFIELKVYASGKSVAPERKSRAKKDRAVVNKGVRDYGLSPDVGRWLLARSELARSTKGLGYIHTLDALAGVHIYLELKTGRRVTMSELAYLIEANNYALGLKPLSVDPNTIEQQLLRHRRAHPEFLKILREDIAKLL